MINMDLDLTAVTQQIDNIKKAAEKAIRPAAQAGAQVYYAEVKLRAKRGNEVRHLKGGRTRPAGLLASSIYQVYSKDNSDAQHATYHISWNARIAPHGHLVEMGTSRAPKSPFVRPAYEAMKNAAAAAVNAELEKRIKDAL